MPRVHKHVGMKIYTSFHGRRNPDGWVVVPISTSVDPAPQYLAVFDTESEAVTEADRLNREPRRTPVATRAAQAGSLQKQAEALWFANRAARAMHEAGDHDGLFTALEPVRAAFRNSDPRILTLACRIHGAWHDLFAEETAAAQKKPPY